MKSQPVRLRAVCACLRVCEREREREIEREREREDRKRKKDGGWREPVTEQEVKIQKEKQWWWKSDSE